MKEPVVEDENLKKIEEMFETRSIWDRLHALMTGLAKPRGSREYKEALIELQRLMAPIAAVLIPTLAIAILIVCATPNSGKKELLNVQIAQAEQEQELEDTPEEIPQDMDVTTTDVEVSMDSVDVAVNVANPADMATPTTQTTPITTVDAVMDIRAPVMMKNVFSSGRSAAGRKASLAKYGGDAFTEACVMRALRWLVTQQQPDGSWKGYSPADGLESTGFVILTFLSHGEKPGSQSEFGKTVQRGLEYLMKKARADRLDAAGVHALAEAYGMTRNPNVRSDVEHALNTMADRLAERVWGPGREGTKEVRPRLLPMTFETMALRSAKLSHFKLKNMDRALMKLKEGFLIQGNAKLGGFSNDNYGPPNVNYRRTGIWHSMVGVVAMQYLGGRYVWGGQTLGVGVDCSGFMKAVYAHFGIYLYRCSYEQVNNGRRITFEELRPGDLIFYKTTGTGQISHVAMYIGNGQIIHARSKEKGIMINRYNLYAPVAYVNVIGD